MKTRFQSRDQLILIILTLMLVSIACGLFGEESATQEPTQESIEPSVTSAVEPQITPGEPTEMPEPESATYLAIQPPSGDYDHPFDLQKITVPNAAAIMPWGQLTLGYTDVLQANLVFSKYSTSLGVHTYRGDLTIWQVPSGELTFEAHSGQGEGGQGVYRDVAISSRYDELVVTTGVVYSDAHGDMRSVAMLWDPAESTEPLVVFDRYSAMRTEVYETQGMNGAAFSPDGALAAAGSWEENDAGGYVWIWDVDSGEVLHEIALDLGVTDVVFSPDTGELVCATYGGVIFFDPMTGEETRRFAYEWGIHGVVFSADGKFLALEAEHVTVVNSQDGSIIYQTPNSTTIMRASFSPDSAVLATTDRGVLSLWDFQTGSELISLWGEFSLLDVAFSPNGYVLATVDEIGQVYMWGVRETQSLPENMSIISPNNVTALQESARLMVPYLSGLTFSPSADWLMIASQNGITQFDLPSFEPLFKFPIEDRYAATYDLSATGALIAWMYTDSLISVYDLTQDRLILDVADFGEYCCSQVLLSPGGELLITLSEFTATIYDLDTLAEIHREESVLEVYMSPDGSTLAFASVAAIEVTLWDVATQREVGVLSGYSTAAPYYFVEFSPDWETMIWGARAHIQFTDVASGELGAEFPLSGGVFSPDGSLFAGSEDGWYGEDFAGQVFLIDVASGVEIDVLQHAERELIDAIAFSPDGRLIAVAINNTVTIWDTNQRVQRFRLPQFSEGVWKLGFSPDGRILSVHQYGNVISFWTVAGEAEVEDLTINPMTASDVVVVNEMQFVQEMTDAAFSMGGDTVAVSDIDGDLYYWHLPTDGAPQGSPLHSEWIYQIEYSPTGDGWASVSMDGKVYLWSNPQSLWGASEYPTGEISGLAFFPDGDVLVTGGEDQNVNLWTIPTVRFLDASYGHTGWIWDVDVSPDGRYVASASADRSVRIWEVSVTSSGDYDLGAFATLNAHTATVWSVAFSPDSRTVASGSWDGTIRIWNVLSGTEVMTLLGHDDWIYDVAFSPDGQLLASTSRDGTVKLWDVLTGNLLINLDEHDDLVWSVDFSPDGRYMATASDDKSVKIWGVVP